MERFTRFKPRVANALLAGFLLTFAGAPASAALCVWRKPDQDIKTFFPGADTYRTDLKSVGSRRAAIEKRLGARLDPDETEFKLYRVLDGGRQVGTIMTHLAKGQYGAIEVVVAVDNQGVVKGVGIQRDRERARKALRSEAFLGQFRGKKVSDSFEVGKTIQPAAKDAEVASRAVAFSVKKLLIILDELG